MKYFFVFVIVLLGWSCSERNLNETSAEKFASAIADKLPPEEIQKYLGSNFIYEDVILKQEYTNPSEFTQSFNFQDTAFHFSKEKFLSITNKTTSEDGKVWLKGEIHPYRYKQNEVEAMRFVWILDFDEQGYISRLENWQDHSINEIINVYQFRQQTSF